MTKKQDDVNREEKKEEIISSEENLINDSEKDELKEENKDEIIEKLTIELDEQKKKSDEYFEHLKRNMAEFDNYKKRMEKERDSLYKSVVVDILEGFLPIMDNFEQALNNACTDDTYKDGINMIYSKFREYLTSQGIEEIEDLGKTFDPNFHEAVMHEEIESKGEKEIVEVFRKGYKIGEKVIRHSMVKVAN